MSFSLGIDFGTSGARSILVNSLGQIAYEVEYQFPSNMVSNLTENWQIALFEVIGKIPGELREKIGSIAINGTSSTVLLCNEQGQSVTEPLLYNDGRGGVVLDKIIHAAPVNHPVISATSSLAKLLWWLNQDEMINYPASLYFCHQADWLGFLLHGKLGISDYHNALKLGYDVANLIYPDWLITLIDQKIILPKIQAPGTSIGLIKSALSQRFNLPPNCLIKAGTTDSIAAFLASGARIPGQAVTSLGSTLVLKLLSETRVDNQTYGIYSHRLGNLWLVGGASNTGGAVLRHFFSDQELRDLSREISPDQISDLDYYPLLKKGDRFPINDPNLLPKLDPKPANKVEFLHGLLESMARIEAQGYQLLQQLGATPLTQVYTAGGGAQNSIWRAIRQRHLQVSVCQSPQTAAAYGTALLGGSELLLRT